jgi:hypothetical protein
MPTLSDPFIKSEFLGAFVWSKRLTEDLSEISKWIYTACHAETLEKNIACGKLGRRASFDVRVSGEKITTPCIWLTPQGWHNKVGHNHFGPFVVMLKMRELEGKQFYVFARTPDRGDRRYYFVQREELEPLWRSRPHKYYDPRQCFDNSRAKLSERCHVQYDIVLTESVSLARARVRATNHDDCNAGKERCRGQLFRRDTVAMLEKLLGRKLEESEVSNFPDPFPLRKVIPEHRLPQEMQPA